MIIRIACPRKRSWSPKQTPIVCDGSIADSSFLFLVRPRASPCSVRSDALCSKAAVRPMQIGPCRPSLGGVAAVVAVCSKACGVMGSNRAILWLSNALNTKTPWFTTVDGQLINFVKQVLDCQPCKIHPLEQTSFRSLPTLKY